MVDAEDRRPTVLLGPPGSGKSALLARLGHQLRATGHDVFALKADRLPREVSSLGALREYLGTPTPVAAALERLGRHRRVVLLVDQLDALSDLVDVHTERLSVMLDLITVLAEGETVRVVCSARTFDFRHDVRFQRFSGRELKLGLPTISEVDAALGEQARALPPRLKELLRTPQWLKAFQRLSFDSTSHPPTTWLSLMEQVWQQHVASGTVALAAESALSALAKEIAEREELWVARAIMDSAIAARLIESGILAVTSNDLKLGFAHQSFFEFARARSFVAHESLASYASAKQGSLFVRPTIWTGLGYLREADPARYRTELQVLFEATLRPHLRLLLLEFLGQQEAPTDQEISLMLPLFSEPKWSRAASAAVAGSPGWFAALRDGVLPVAMESDQPGICFGILEGALPFERDAVLRLVRAHWAERWPDLVLHLLTRLDEWDDAAFQLATNTLAGSPQRHPSFGALVWHLAKRAPAYAARLVGEQLTRELATLEPSLPRSVPLPAEATLSEQMTWYANREPRRTLEHVLASASSISCLVELAEAAPRELLDGLLPWFAAVLDAAARDETSDGAYRDPHMADARAVPGLPRELPDALRAASEALAIKAPDEFFELLDRWSRSDLAPVHVTLSYGLEAGARHRPDAVLQYLVEDDRRLRLGDYSCAERRTVAVINALGGNLDEASIGSLEAAILASRPRSETTGDVEARRYARDANRRHRLRLLMAVPRDLLSPATRQTLEQEELVFGLPADPAVFLGRMREVTSPMSASQMEKAADDHVVGLFDELTDDTGWDHPRRFMDGGSVQAAREFSAFAKNHPLRAVRLMARFRPGLQEQPAGEALGGLADSELSTEELEALIVDLDAKGFHTDDFRTDASWALGKRASGPEGLSAGTIAMMQRWLAEVEPLTDPSSDEPDEPPFLWGYGHGGVLPRGSFPAMEALTVAFLSSEPVRANEWLTMLRTQLGRDYSETLWLALARRLTYLGACGKREAAGFLDELFGKCPGLLSTGDGVMLVAHGSWWADGDTLQCWVAQVRQRFLFGSDALVQLAVTLQRIPNYREDGLSLFERLLELGCYGARRALDDVDSRISRRP